MLDETCAILEDWTSKSFVKRVWAHGDFAAIADGIDRRINVFRDAFSVTRLIALSSGQEALNTKIQALVDQNTHTNLEKWLQPANVALSLRDAAEKRHEKTGMWLFERAEYREWIYTPHSLLWLHGISGCGKTILSSTIINTLRKRAEPIAFFYFDTNNYGQQTVTQLLCSLVTQLSDQTPMPDTTLATLWGYYAHGHQLPTTSELISEALIPILREFTHPVYIVIDALDECSERNKLLESFTQIVDAQLSNFHLLLTSRPEVPRIVHAVSVSLEGCVDQDIESYVTEIMATLDVDFTPERKAQIKAGLLERSGGMFRLVSLQLEQLRGCDGRESQITKALADMPTSLETIYDRILHNIKNPDMVSTVFRAMNWFTFSTRPIEIAEIIDALAFNFEQEPLRFNPAERMAPKALLQACAGFVVESTDKQGHIIVKLAHASVKEYFLSVKHSTDLSSDLEVSEQKAHDFIARTCIGYLCSPSHALITDVDLYQYPLVVYALENWAFHVNSCDETGLAQGQEVELHKPNMLNPHASAFARQYASLLKQGADMAAEGGSYCNALQVASFHGHTKIVRQLLEQGVDVNAEGGGFYASALQAASRRGHVDLVHLLLDHGADVNMQGGLYCNALQSASKFGHVELVGVLLDRGADVNAEGGFHGSALQAACEENHTKIAHLLLERGAEVNLTVQGRSSYANALQAASNNGQMVIVRLLLEHGAEEGHPEIVCILLEQGAEVNAQGGYCGNALKAACCGGNIDIVRQLLEHGADVKAEGGECGHALQAAAWGGNTDIVRLLLEQGAEVKTQGGKYGNALQAASAQGSTEIVHLLLERSAEVNIQGGYYGNALQAACCSGQIEIVHMLLDQGADVNAQGGRYETALQAACYSGHIEVVRPLLGQGAKMEMQGGVYGNALRAACCGGHTETAHLLLEKGADVNAKGTSSENALQAASGWGHIEIVCLLLDHGADVNAPGGNYGTAVQAALGERHHEIVRLLYEHGAELPDQVGSGEVSSSSV
ncbi:ankyrin repeat-containing domain protein [Mycena latifolia]|nr:ankyrin repeat-containing domain protein [Mycena latifolia]